MLKIFEKLFKGKTSGEAENGKVPESEEQTPPAEAEAAVGALANAVPVGTTGADGPLIQLSSLDMPTLDMGLTGVPELSTKTIFVSYATNIGKVRDGNEDNYYVDSVGLRLQENESGEKKLDWKFPRVFAVCDGMGGEAYGEVASQITADTIRGTVQQIREASSEELDEVIHQMVTAANDRIIEMRKERRCGISGSTLAMVCLYGLDAHIYSIGDSKVYCLEDGILTQINEDQTVAARKVKANIYTEEEARQSSDFSKLTCFVGVDDRGIGLKALTYQPIRMEDQILVLCSDGLSDMCEKEEIAQVLLETNGNKAEALVERALERGGEDNVTCIVIECREEDTRE